MPCNLTHVVLNTASRFWVVGFSYVGIPAALWFQSSLSLFSSVSDMLARFLLRCVAVPDVVGALFVVLDSESSNLVKNY